jgi:hypothetical protein
MSDDKETVTIDLYNANHGKAPRTGGPYRDDIEQEQAEVWRAKAEGREPDLDNPPACASTVLVPKSQLVERDTDKSHFSDSVEVTNEPVDTMTVEVIDPFKGDPDPSQANWDNDMSKVNALQGGLLYNELIEKNNTPDKEPVDHELDDPDFEKDV